MPWLGWVIIASFALLAGVILGLKRQQALCVNELGLQGGERGFPDGYNEPALAVAPHKACAEQPPVQEVITRDLAGLKARRYFMEALDQEWQQSARTGRQSSLILMHLERLKQVIDRRDRLGGSKVPRAVAALVDAGATPPNVVARYEEDEFAILMPGADARQAETLAERLRAAVEANQFLREHGVAACFGIATFPDHARTPDEILRVADSELSLAKRRNGNCVEVGSLRPEPRDSERNERPLATHLEGAVRAMSSTAPETSSFAVDANGPYPKGHSQAVSWLAIQIARQGGLSQAEIDEIHLGGLLHDIGKFDLPERVFRKPTRLTPKEYEIMKSHAARGAKMLEPLNLKAIELIVRHHHERYDGKGYPDGLAGDEIPLGARIVAVAECFEDIVSDLPYKSARTFEDTVAEIRRCSGTQFDPKVAAAFLDWLEIHGDPREQK